MKELVFDPVAKRELEYSAKYYEAQSKGLGRRFLYEVEKGLMLITERPDAWPPMVYDRMRRYLLHYFPYAILYKNDPEAIYVLAIVHLSRKPGYWRGRE